MLTSRMFLTFNLVWVLCCNDCIERPLIGLYCINGISTFQLQVLRTWSLTFEESLEVTKGAKFFVNQTIAFMISICFSNGRLLHCLWKSRSHKLRAGKTYQRQHLLFNVWVHPSKKLIRILTLCPLHRKLWDTFFTFLDRFDNKI